MRPNLGKDPSQRGFRLSDSAKVDVAAWSLGSVGQELFDVLVSVVALTDFHQAGKMEFHPGFDLVRRNVVTTRFQTLRQLFGTAEHAHRLAADILSMANC